jgi:hypothetical protein
MRARSSSTRKSRIEARPQRKISKSRAEVRSISPCGSRTRGPESRYAWLINEAAETPLQFPKNRKMILQLGEALFAGENSPFKNCEFSAASRVGLAILHLREE